jgi:hypothetical protein
MSFHGAGPLYSFLDDSKEHIDRLMIKRGLLGVNMELKAHRCQNCQLVIFSYAGEGHQEDGITHYDEVEKHLL